MSNNYPKVKDEKLSEIRIKEIKKEVIDSFISDAISRDITTPIHSLTEEDKKREFFRIGKSSITNKIFFVDNPPGKTYYSYEGIGWPYGISIAEGELKGIIKHIDEEISDDNKIKINKITETNIMDSVYKLDKNGYGNFIILTNIYDSHSFWDLPRNFFRGFPVSETRRRRFGLITFENFVIPVFYSRVVPRGKTFIIDKKGIGRLLIKQDLECDVIDINMNELIKEKIKKDLPEFTDEQLDEMVNIKVWEIVRFDFGHSNAGIILEREIKE